MKKIENYNLPEHLNKLYIEEASSSIGLAHDVATKVNELVDAYNSLSEMDLGWKQTTEGEIRKAIIFMKDNLLNSIKELYTLLKNSGEIDSIISNSVYDNYSKMYNTLGSIVNVKNYGAFGDGIKDDTNAIKLAIIDAKRKAPCTVFFPKGTYCYTDLGNLAIDGIAFIGEHGYKSTVLKCINTLNDHIALRFDAFENGTEETPFCYGVQMMNIDVIGNHRTDTCIQIRGCTHSSFSNIYAGECKRLIYDIGGVMTSVFTSVKTITRNYKEIETKATLGLSIDTAYRGEVSCGASTNNTFINCYFEDCLTGANLIHCDGNTFTGCAFEYNDEYGIKLENNARMTLINGCGFEHNPLGDYIDNGRLTKMINSYVQYVANVGGANCTIENCLIDSIIVGGLNNEVKNVRLKYHDYSDDSAAFTDNGTGTIVQNIFDIKHAVNIFPSKKRKALTVTESPFEYKNTTNHNVELFVIGGEIGDPQLIREGENGVLLPNVVPARWLCRPNETIRFTFTSAPNVSYIETYER